jgi:hypothetical protein
MQFQFYKLIDKDFTKNHYFHYKFSKICSYLYSAVFSRIHDIEYELMRICREINLENLEIFNKRFVLKLDSYK